MTATFLEADSFASVFGSSRGITITAQTILHAPNHIADEERRRLMDLAVAGEFAQPLAVLRVNCDHLNGKVSNSLDVLNMCTATQMCRHSDRYSKNTALAIYGKENELASIIGPALCSKMAWKMESVLAWSSRRADHLESGWMAEQWETYFPKIMLKWLTKRPKMAIEGFLGDGSAVTGSPLITKDENWQKIVDVLLPQGFSTAVADWEDTRKTAIKTLEELLKGSDEICA
jgi:hypothetical protein